MGSTGQSTTVARAKVRAECALDAAAAAAAVAVAADAADNRQQTHWAAPEPTVAVGIAAGGPPASTELVTNRVLAASFTTTTFAPLTW